MSAIIEAEDIRKSYQSGGKELPVLRGVSVALERASFSALVGPSGAGKSTLLHILGGLDAPSQGAVRFDGQEIYGLSDAGLSRLRNERIGFVFQFYHLLPEFTAVENVCLPALIKAGRQAGRPNAGALRRQAEALLDRVGLIQRSGHFPSQLSGGEQQRVAIARALINRPDLLLCDEPTGNLDTHSGSQILALMKQINRQDGTTVVLVTHNLEIARSSDTIYNLRDGVLVQ